MRLYLRRCRLLILLLAAGCAGSYRQDLKFDPSEPLRVAVLPFYRTDAEGKIITLRDDVYLIDHVPGVSAKVEESPEIYVQGLFETELRQTGFDLVPRAAVEAGLMHGGFRSADGIDLPKLLAASPRQVCERVQCDALVYGRITKWDRSYYVLQSVTTVGLDVLLVRASDGSTLFQAASEDSDSRGLSKGPTGYTSLVLEPIRGLDSDIILELAANVVAQTLQPIATRRDDEAAQVAPPLIFAASHDAQDGALGADKRMLVLAFGTPGASAAFSIGDKIVDVPMYETSPGHYFGEFFPVETDAFSNELVRVSVRDRFGRSVEQQASEIMVSLVPIEKNIAANASKKRVSE